MVERYNRSLIDQLAKMLLSQGVDWDDYVKQVAFAYNSYRHASTRFTPFFLMHGHKAHVPADVLIPNRVDIRWPWYTRLSTHLTRWTGPRWFTMIDWDGTLCPIITGCRWHVTLPPVFSWSGRFSTSLVGKQRVLGQLDTGLGGGVAEPPDPVRSCGGRVVHHRTFNNMFCFDIWLAIRDVGPCVSRYISSEVNNVMCCCSPCYFGCHLLLGLSC